MALFYLAYSCLAAFLMCWFIINHGGLFLLNKNKHLDLPQKIHNGSVSRLGGLSIATGILICVPYLALDFTILSIGIIAILVYSIGLYEDLTHSISAKKRLIIIAILSLLTTHNQNLSIVRIDIYTIDLLLEISIFSIIFSSFAITGIINAFNIIDGLNGLASILGIIAIATITCIANQHNLIHNVQFNLIVMFAIAGFLLWNIPYGKIFLGDGGAYLIGFIVACNAIYMSNKIPDISPWFFIIICIYPIVETIFSIYRRLRLKNNRALNPDFDHLHSLIYKYLRNSQITINFSNKIVNTLGSILIISCSLAIALLGYFFRANTPLLQFFITLYLLTYIYLYHLLKKFI